MICALRDCRRGTGVLNYELVAVLPLREFCCWAGVWWIFQVHQVPVFGENGWGPAQTLRYRLTAPPWEAKGGDA